MDAASDPNIPEVVAIIASQMAKTETTLNVVGFHIHHDPAPMMFLLPTLEMAEAWSKDRLAPMLRDTPSLRGRVREARSRDSGNTIRHKTFPGGHLTASGANSAVSLSMRPIRLLLADEIDGYNVSAGTEGNPLKLAETRTRAFWNAKRIYITSPRNKGSSLSESIWERSDKRRYFVPCHACGHEQHLRWAQVTWDKDELGQGIASTARYVCEACGEDWNDAQRWAAVRKGRWQATAPFRGCAGFHLNALASPWESRRLSAIVQEWLDAQGLPELLKVFINTVLAEYYEEKYHTLQSEDVEKRREIYPTRGGVNVVPRGVAVVVAGVDVQDDRLEVQIQGYGRGFEQWKLEYHVLDGDPSGVAVWDDLWNLMRRPLPLERGGVTFIRASAIDTQGHHTLKAYDYCRPRFRVRCEDGRLSYTFAIRGKGGSGEFWPRQPSRNNKGKIPLFTVHVDHAKEILYACLDRVKEPGSGFIHFPLQVQRGAPFDRRYFDQLTSEKVVDRRAPDGTIARVWELKSEGRRNEALDTSVYGEAALRGLIAMGFDLDQEAMRLARTADSEVEASPSATAPEPDAPSPAPSRPRRTARRSTSRFLER